MNFLRFGAASIFIFSLGSVGFAKTHVLKKGETLASVARAYYGEPVFGPKGTLQKIYKLNPWALKTPSLVQPGQAVEIEDKEASAPHAPIVAAVVAQAPVSEEVPPAPPAPPVPVAAAPPAGEAPAATLVVPPQPPPPHPEEPAAHAAPHAEDARGFFWIAPSYVSIQQKATEEATGESFEVNSSSAYALELGWDHWWNDSFSSVISYGGMQRKSDAKNATTGALVADSVDLYKGELILFNRLTHSLRFGFGAGYGDHVFIEGLSSSPADPHFYKVSFWNPLVAADWIAFENKSFEMALGLKAGFLPAQFGTHDIKSGVEYAAQLGLTQKMGSWSLLYAITYLADDQTLKGATEKRTETAGKIGILF